MIIILLLAVIAVLLFTIARKGFHAEAKENEKAQEENPEMLSLEYVSTKELNAELWKRQINAYLTKRFQGNLVAWRYSDEKMKQYAHTYSPIGVEIEMVNGETISMKINPIDIRMGYKPVILPAIKVDKPKINVAQEWIVQNAGKIDDAVQAAIKENKTSITYPYGDTIEVENEAYNLDDEVVSSIIKSLNSNTEYEVSIEGNALLIDFSIMTAGTPIM